ncbi:hypothetical protein ACIQ1J_10120 [Streptomyces sp. NPDC097107]|uniref:hypothetical protein n=1 Tax=Streptomyces sp. NPDC097107 TaxID=3366089 RepID=UPI0037FAC4DC
MTGDTESAVPILVEIVQELTDGTHLPVMLPAVRYLTRMGHAAQPAVRLLRDLPASDRRIHYFGGWRAFAEDESLHTAVDELLATAHWSGSPTGELGGVHGRTDQLLTSLLKSSAHASRSL